MAANYFTILYCFCHTSTWIPHGCTHVPHPEPPSHRPPRTIPLGHPSAPAPSILYPASNLDWWFVSHMVLYLFQCHAPKSYRRFLQCHLLAKWCSSSVCFSFTCKGKARRSVENMYIIQSINKTFSPTQFCSFLKPFSYFFYFQIVPFWFSHSHFQPALINLFRS